MTHIRHGMLLLALTALLCLGLTACAGGGSGAGTEAPTQAEVTASETEDLTTPATEAPLPPTDAPTEPVTEPATEPETEADTVSRSDWLYGNDLVPDAAPARACAVGGITLLGHDISEFTVVIPEWADDYEAEAGQTLCTQIANACGITPALKRENEGESACEIVLGTTGRDTDGVRARRQAIANTESFFLYAEGTRLYVSGVSGRSTYYGAIELMERYLGIVFCTGDYVAAVPADNIVVPEGLDLTVNTPFLYRQSYYKFVEGWAQKYHRMRPLSYAGGLQVHTLPRLAGTDKVQLCMTDEGIYQTVLENVRAALAGRPDGLVNISQADCYMDAKGCQCDACRALNEQYGCEGASLFAFVNRLARDIRDEFPTARIETLAYAYYTDPPVGMTFEDNVSVRLCLWPCFQHRVGDPACDIDRGNMDLLDRWAEVCGSLTIWDYQVSFQCYNLILPNEDALYDYITYYAQRNVISVFSEGSWNSLCGNFEELRSYASCRLMNDPSLSYEDYCALIDNFLKAYYGSGWVYIRRFMDVTKEKAAGARACFGAGSGYKDVLRKDGESQEFLNGAADLFLKAEAAAATEEQKAHVRKASAQLYLYGKEILHDKVCAELFSALQKEFGLEMYNEGARF